MKLNILKKRLNRDDFSSQITKLVIPIVLQNLLSASVNSADVIMLNFVGQSSISAVSLAAQYTSILFMVFFGLGTGASILTAQYFGKNDFKAIAAIQGIALRFSISFSILFGVAALTIPELMMLLFTKDPELIEIGASYLRILSISFFCCGIVEIYLSVLRSVSRVVVSTALNTFAFTSNILLNAVFIFGLFGAPKLGAVGVAIATSLSRLMELILCFIVSAASRNVKLDFKAIFIRNKLLFKDFIRLSLPALGNDIVWGVGFSMYSVIIGHMSSDAVAANSFVVVVRNFGTILCFGFSSAGGILLGQLIGENKLEQAALYAKKLLKLTVITGAVGGLIVLGAIPVLMNFASLNETGMHYLKYMLLINTYYVMGAAVNTTLIVGAFRAGGDSRFGFICDLIDMWVYAVPLGFFAAFVLKLPVLWVYFLLCTDEFVKWPWVIRHYRSGKWLKNITRDNLFEETPNTDSVSVG
ncbi:MAG TPA: MATE family efflux transporter [Candidatus Faecivivens stercoripullorum]|uniref:MATE family efflux transporter n=1 Tax=Candidatus Faecivivens stercoripullorum TaxID=2840805 RepID=A0A9D1H5J2_9FIRM|nr:MATE family efflux transporter [Candidatus Faecivivens stercoripullorum]